MPAPDLRHDVDALFAHMLNNLEHSLAKPLDWTFFLTTKDLKKLKALVPTLSKKYRVELDEQVETYERGRRFMGPPLLSAVITAALSPKQVKAHAAKFRALAEKHKLTYDGVSACEPFDEQELFGWLDLPSARWRLRHHSDAGTPDSAELPFLFAISGKPKALRSLAASLKPASHKLDRATLLAQFRGSNNEKVLASHYRKVKSAAAELGAEVQGVQFFEIQELELQ